MAKRVRSEEEERESWWSTAKRQMSDGGRNVDLDDDILALLYLDLKAEDDGIGAALLTAGSDSPSFFDAYDDKDNEVAAGGARVRFAEDPYRSSPAGVFQTTASSYVTINGNDETCGSSFSDWDSSVMASVDVGGLGRALLAGPGGAWVPSAGEYGGDSIAGGEWECEDVSLASFLDEVLSSEQQQPWMA